MEALTGKILLYRVFDIGNDVDLERTHSILVSESNAQRFRLNKSSRAMIINNAPLAINLEGGKYETCGVTLDYDVHAKIWHFGAISLVFQISVPPGTEWNKWIELGSSLENDQQLHSLAMQKCTQILQQMNPVRLQQLNWETFEDYILYFFKNLPGVGQNAWSAFEKYDIFRLVLSENTETLSQQVKDSVLEGCFQYSQNDLAVINWNSALLIEPTGSMDIPDVIEFALCQLLEMRYYDDVLDEKLNSLYTALEKRRLGLFESYAEKLSQDAAQKYLEISDTIESVENSLKVVGDFYLAKIFRSASGRFRFKDWQESVNQKLNNLAEISKLLSSEINERRNRTLEIIVIALISVEVVPYLIQFFRSHF